MDTNLDGIALIGMTGRFPGAANVDEFWRNLVAGVESISFFSDEELAASGLDVAALRKDPSNVAARGVLKDAEWFDASFFNISPKEAEVLDPQQRLFLEAAWEALENAGYDPARATGYIGVYAGMSPNTYFWNNVHSHPDVIRTVGRSTAIGDFLATRVAYKLNLRGPAFSVYTACSTSLVAVSQACQALLGYQCDLALAGGVSVSFPQKRTYYQDGGMFSPDGHCRPFDAKAAGTNFSDALGVVVLKRLAEAVKDGDQVYAVIKGFGLNNDGSAKAGFAAPSVNGQAEVIALAQAQAGFEPATISYVEAHGTATPLGDPIEIEGLTQAFRTGTSRKNFCAIGSVKSNIGHADAAAGIAGLIKTALALKEKTLPPSLHFTAPNPKIDFANSPFFVNAKLAEWKPGPTPRRAGLSSFGIGGTNVHLVLEEAPPLRASGPSRDAQLLLLSARTGPALEAATAHLAAHLQAHPGLDLADAAFTLQTGRRVFDHRRMLVCRDAGDAIAALEARDPKRLLTQQGKTRERPVIFMFPGQGAQYVNMGADLYRTEAAFRAEIDRCAEILRPHLDLDLRHVLFPAAEQTKAAEELLVQTRLTQPALFAIEYALARLWMSWGVQPRAMIGHSVGEYVAACLAGVFTLEEALALVAGRGRLVQALPGGAMLAVRLPEEPLRALLPNELSLAAINSVSLGVVSGPFDAIDKFEAQLKAQGVAARRLQTSHAFHSAMMDPALAPLTALLDKVRFQSPGIPYLSNVTGRWIADDEATDPRYWTRHLREAVRFSDGVGELLQEPENILLEVGPGQALTSLANQHPAKTASHAIISSFSPAREPEAAGVLGALGKLWLAGASVDWAGFYQNEKRSRVTLPTYPFERKRFWIEPAAPIAPAGTTEPAPAPLLPTATVALTAEESNGEPDRAVARRDRILAALTAQFQELSTANLADVGPSASFMEMGLDSLFLGQASLAIESRFGLRITFRQMFEELPTLNDLADYLDRKLPPEAFATTPVAAAPVTAVAAPAPGTTLEMLEAQLRALTRQVETLRREGSAAPTPETTGSVTLPLTDQQTELWLASQAGEDASRAFNQVFAIRLGGQVQVEAIAGILQQLVDRHDAFRTTFATDGETQRIASTWKLQLVPRDLSGLSEPEQERAIKETLVREDQTAFDLATGPLFRFQLLQLSQTRSVFILAAHHLVLDGWSIGVVLREFSVLYDAAARGATAQLERAMQYRDYVRWQADPGRHAAVEAARTYWLKQFSPLPEDLELPTDHPRPPVKTYRVGQQDVVLEAPLYASLKQAASAHGCTLFVFLLAALKAWMFRLTGAHDLVVGIAAAGQLVAADEPGNRSLVGHCVHTLPMRSTCEGGATFSDYLKILQGRLLDAHEHQDITLGTLVRKLQLRTDPSRAPLMPLVFNLGRVSRQLRVPGAEFAFAPKGFGFFDINIDAHDSGQEIHLACRYNTALFDDASISRKLDHFRTLLASAAKNTGQRIADLPLLTEAERRQVLVDWNRTTADFPRDRCAHELIEEQAMRAPGAVAVTFGPERLTYAELNARANRLAHHLRRQGVGPDTLIGLCLERSLDLVVGLLGILKAGGAYVPLDPNYPADRLAFLIEDSGTKLILTRQSLRPRLGTGPARLLCLDTEGGAIAQESGDDLARAATPDHLAYVIYTSGSTGRPKGVLLEHRGLCNLVAAQIRELEIGPGSRVLQFSSISFDASVSEIFTALAGGATLCLAEFEKLLPGPDLLALLRGERISVATLTPSVLHAISEADLPALKTVVSAGEACTPELAARWGCGRRLINGYGPTEATVCASMKVIDPAATTLTIGRPIANAEFYILDGQLRPVPVGVAGELHIGGIGLARGYHNRAALTAEKFIAHPFSTVPGARLYQTGDRARFLPNGEVEYLGRLDHQVKIRGFRVELGEIEEALNRHPGVEASVVVAREDTPGDKRLVAYLIGRHGTVPPAELRESLRARLPEFMVPSAFITLPAWPLSPSGKVDRQALPRPDFETGADRGNFAAPGTPTEIALAAIWCEVLGLKQVGIRDNFFDLGGHSLLAVRITNRINQALQSHLAIPALFQNPTIAQLAAILDREKRDRRETAPSPDNNRSASPLIAFQSQGSRPPLFFMHGDWTGGGFYCGRLSRELGGDQPFYVVPPLRLDRKTTIEEMASAHIATIQDHTPHGPYLLGGYCVGAVVTMEIARQLTEKGETVLHLFLIDPTPLSSPWLRWAWLAIDTVGEIRAWDLRKKIACFDHSAVTLNRWLVKPLRSKLVALGNRLGLRRWLRSESTAAAPDEGGGDEAAMLNSLDYEVYMLAFRLCRPQPLPVPAIFYMPVETHPSRLARVYRLRALFPAVTVEMVPGDHRTCIIAHAPTIGQKMRQAIGLA